MTERLEEAPEVSLPLDPGRSLCFEAERDGLGETEEGGTGERRPSRRCGGGSIS